MLCHRCSVNDSLATSLTERHIVPADCGSWRHKGHVYFAHAYTLVANRESELYVILRYVKE